MTSKTEMRIQEHDEKNALYLSMNQVSGILKNLCP